MQKRMIDEIRSYDRGRKPRKVSLVAQLAILFGIVTAIGVYLNLS
jgi:hypothetical protein